jgi:hypothetical protein
MAVTLLGIGLRVSAPAPRHDDERRQTRVHAIASQPGAHDKALLHVPPHGHRRPVSLIPIADRALVYFLAASGSRGDCKAKQRIRTES